LANTLDAKKDRYNLVTVFFLIAALVIFGVSIIFSGSLLLTGYLKQGPSSNQSDNSPDTTSIASRPLTDNIAQHSLSTAIENNFGIDYDVPPEPQAANTVRIPVLTYHHIDTLPNSNSRDYYVSPKMFDEQMKYLSDKNYRSLTPKEFYDQLKTGKNPTHKSVMITFDDGNVDNYKNAYPILLKYGFVGVFYVPSNKRGMTNSQLQEMANHGMIIDPHGKTHMMLSKVTDSGTLYQELVASKINLQNVTGQISNSFCYPGCEYNGYVTSMLASNGYLLAFSCGKSIDHKLGSRLVLSRMHVYNDMQDFKSILSGKWYYPGGYSS